MPIVCGTDFSRSSARAVRVAALLARRLGEPLVLVHVVDWAHTELLGMTALEVNPARERLRRVAERVRRRGLEVREEIASGAPDEALVDSARRAGARLVVVASLGRRAPARWLLGSVAERTTQTSPVPVLVVRQSAGFRRWAQDGWPLRVLAGADASAAGDAALDGVRELDRLGPCEVVVAYAYSSDLEGRRLGVGDPGGTAAGRRAEIERVLRRDLAARAALPEGRVRFRLEASLGRVADQLVDAATEAGADVIVVGTRRRPGTSRLWHRSVSNAVLHLAPMSVLSVPVAERPGARPIPRWRRVLAPTDFSELGDRAVPHAYAALATGGTVHLMHVVEPPGAPATPEQRAGREWDVTAKLRALIPQDAEERGRHALRDRRGARRGRRDPRRRGASRRRPDLSGLARPVGARLDAGRLRRAAGDAVHRASTPDHRSSAR